MTTLKELASEYQDDAGTIEAHELPGLEEYCSGASVFQDEDGDTCTVYLFIQESLQFHGDYGTSALERNEDGDGWELTAEAFRILPGIIAERYEGENFDVAGDVFSFDLALTLPAATPVEDVAGLFWERSNVVQFMNESDPGTFGSPYLFGTVFSDAVAAQG